LFFNWLVGPNAPAWVAEAKSRPLLESIGTSIENLLPEDPENSILKKLNSQGGEPEAGTATPPAEAPPKALLPKATRPPSRRRRTTDFA
jgi:membrane protein required for colicin V production